MIETHDNQVEAGTWYFQSVVNQHLYGLVGLVASASALHYYYAEHQPTISALFTLQVLIALLGQLLTQLPKDAFHDRLESARCMPIPDLPVNENQLGPLAKIAYQKELTHLYSRSDK